MTDFTYKIYPPLGVARVGNGPASTKTSTFTPAVPWQNLYDTSVEYLVTKDDLQTLLKAEDVQSLLDGLSGDASMPAQVTLQMANSSLGQWMSLAEIARFVDDITFDSEPQTRVEQFNAACLKALCDKYQGAIKKQAQRFSIYKFDASGACCGKLSLDEVESLEWQVDVANKKAFWYDYNNALDLSLDETNGNLSDTVAQGQVAPGLMAKLRNPNVVEKDYRKQLVIRSQGTIDNHRRGQVILSGKFPANVDPDEHRLTDLFDIEARHNVKQGSIEFDHSDGSLLFFAGDGISRALVPSSLNTDFADNSNWYDDICDGRITATLTLKNSAEKICLDQTENSAWIATAPPNYAPQIEPLVTLYDMVTGASYDDASLQNIKTQFSDVFPILYRLYRMQWVNQADFADNSLNDELKDIEFNRLLVAGDSEKALRERIFKRFRNPIYTEGAQIERTESGELISKSRLIPSKDQTNIKPSPTPAPLQLPYYPGDGVDYPGSPLQWFAIPPFMYKHLENWAAGDFSVSEAEVQAAQSIESLGQFYSGVFAESPHSAWLCARAALDDMYGGGFHPGVELTWPMRRKQMYAINTEQASVSGDINLLGLREFRINATADIEAVFYRDYGRVITADDVRKSVAGDAAAKWLWQITPGDLTKWMGIPWQSDAASCQAVYTEQDFPVPAWWAANLPVTIVPAARYEQFKQGYSPESPSSEESVAVARQAQFAARQPWLQTADMGFVGYHAIGGYTNGLIAMVQQWKNMGMVMARPGTVSGKPDSDNIPEVVYVSYGQNNKHDAQAD